MKIEETVLRPDAVCEVCDGCFFGDDAETWARGHALHFGHEVMLSNRRTIRGVVDYSTIADSDGDDGA